VAVLGIGRGLPAGGNGIPQIGQSDLASNFGERFRLCQIALTGKPAWRKTNAVE